MKQFTVKLTDGKEVVYDFPTSIDEISSEYLEEITKPISVANHYCLIGLVCSNKLSNLILSARSDKQNAKLHVTPIFIKAGETDIEFIKKAKLKQRVLAVTTQIALGVHVNPPYHKLTIDHFTNSVINTSDKDIYSNELQNPDQSKCCFIEFKIVPATDIVGLLDMGSAKPYINPVTSHQSDVIM